MFTENKVKVGSTVQLGVGADSSVSACQTPEDKIAAMRRVTEATLEKAMRHSERKQGFVKAAKVMNTISSAVIKPMLQTEAVASLAVSTDPTFRRRGAC